MGHANSKGIRKFDYELRINIVTNPIPIDLKLISFGLDF